MDGMLKIWVQFAHDTGLLSIPVIASGGVGNLDHLVDCDPRRCLRRIGGLNLSLCTIQEPKRICAAGIQ